MNLNLIPLIEHSSDTEIMKSKKSTLLKKLKYDYSSDSEEEKKSGEFQTVAKGIQEDLNILEEEKHQNHIPQIDEVDEEEEEKMGS